MKIIFSFLVIALAAGNAMAECPLLSGTKEIYRLAPQTMPSHPEHAPVPNKEVLGKANVKFSQETSGACVYQLLSVVNSALSPVSGDQTLIVAKASSGDVGDSAGFELSGNTESSGAEPYSFSGGPRRFSLTFKIFTGSDGSGVGYTTLFFE